MRKAWYIIIFIIIIIIIIIVIIIIISFVYDVQNYVNVSQFVMFKITWMCPCLWCSKLCECVPVCDVQNYVNVSLFVMFKIT